VVIDTGKNEMSKETELDEAWHKAQLSHRKLEAVGVAMNAVTSREGYEVLEAEQDDAYDEWSKDLDAYEAMRERPTLDKLAQEQNVKPITDIRVLVIEDVPGNDSARYAALLPLQPQAESVVTVSPVGGPVNFVSVEQARYEQPFWCLCDPKQLYLHNNTDSSCRHEHVEALHNRIALLKAQLQIANNKLFRASAPSTATGTSEVLKALDAVGGTLDLAYRAFYNTLPSVPYDDSGDTK